MKKLLMASLVLLPAIANAQDRLVTVKNGADTLYTASGYTVYVGQKLKIGTGSTPDGDFKFIRKSSTSLFSYYSTTGRQGEVNRANALPRNQSGHEYKVIRIDDRGNKKHGYVYYPILQSRYEVDINNAISSGEIVVPEEFRPKDKVMQVEMKSSLSVSDELVKLKKLKDDSLITDEEYQVQRKKLLDK